MALADGPGAEADYPAAVQIAGMLRFSRGDRVGLRCLGNIRKLVQVQTGR